MAIGIWSLCIKAKWQETAFQISRDAIKELYIEINERDEFYLRIYGTL